jgi:hypothetical protein
MSCLVAFVKYAEQCAGDRFQTTGTDVNTCGRFSGDHCSCHKVLCVPGQVTFDNIMTCRYEDSTCQFLQDTTADGGADEVSPAPSSVNGNTSVPLSDGALGSQAAGSNDSLSEVSPEGSPAPGITDSPSEVSPGDTPSEVTGGDNGGGLAADGESNSETIGPLEEANQEETSGQSTGA